MSKSLWGIHAGRTGNADALFLRDNCVAIGWAEMGDLSKLSPNRNAFRDGYVVAYPNAKQGGIARIRRPVSFPA